MAKGNNARKEVKKPKKVKVKTPATAGSNAVKAPNVGAKKT